VGYFGILHRVICETTHLMSSSAIPARPSAVLYLGCNVRHGSKSAGRPSVVLNPRGAGLWESAARRATPSWTKLMDRLIGPGSGCPRSTSRGTPNGNAVPPLLRCTPVSPRRQRCASVDAESSFVMILHRCLWAKLSVRRSYLDENLSVRPIIRIFSDSNFLRAGAVPVLAIRHKVCEGKGVST
jgi:hypothetical protein